MATGPSAEWVPSSTPIKVGNGTRLRTALALRSSSSTPPCQTLSPKIGVQAPSATAPPASQIPSLKPMLPLSSPAWHTSRSFPSLQTLSPSAQKSPTSTPTDSASQFFIVMPLPPILLPSAAPPCSTTAHMVTASLQTALSLQFFPLNRPGQ